jgi:hypothetical protein
LLKFKEPVILLRTCWLIFVNNTCRRVCIDWLYWYSNRSVTGYRFPYSSPLLSIPNLKHAIRIVRYSFWKSHFYFYLFQNLLKKCNKFSICLNYIIFYDSFLCRKHKVTKFPQQQHGIEICHIILCVMFTCWTFHRWIWLVFALIWIFNVLFYFQHKVKYVVNQKLKFSYKEKNRKRLCGLDKLKIYYIF